MLGILALGSSLSWGTADFLAGLASRRRHPVAVVGWTQGLAFLVLCAVVLLRPADVPVGQWLPWAAAAGVSGLVGLTCFYTALSTGTMGVVAPIAGLGVVVPVGLGVLGGERPSALAWVGMSVAVLGVTLASGPELRGGMPLRPVLLASAAAAGFGFTLWFLDRGARESTLMTLWGMRLTSLVILVTVALLVRTAGGVTARELPLLLVIGCGDLGANALFAVASSRGQVSIASVLGSLYPVVTAVLARLVLDERLERVQQVGVVLAVGGAVLIAV